MAPNADDLSHKLLSMAQDIAKQVNVLGPSKEPDRPKSQLKILVAGATAGLVVDTSLFPIDTIKARLQSKQGFFNSGGFKNVYRGIQPVLAGSIPNAALFFITYETIKEKLHQNKTFGFQGAGHIFNHVVAASVGEVVSCAVRVPYEVVKIRAQTSPVGQPRMGSLVLASHIFKTDGINGLYRGFKSTIIRDIPFSAIQYPVWERLKLNHLAEHGQPATAAQSAIYGSIAGGIAAFATTPLDVARTRIVLAEPGDHLSRGKVIPALSAIYSERGIRALFAGAIPRVLWISAGAFIFLGAYEQTIKMVG